METSRTTDMWSWYKALMYTNSLKKAVSDGEGDLLKLNELSSLQHLLHGEEQLPLYPGLNKGLVAVILYYDGRRAVAQALRTLKAGKPGLTCSTEMFLRR